MEFPKFQKVQNERMKKEHSSNATPPHTGTTDDLQKILRNLPINLTPCSPIPVKYGCESKPRVVTGPPTTPCYIPLSRPVVTYLCRECLAQVCPTKEPCRKGACRKPGDSVTNLCRGMAAEACYKPRVFDLHAGPRLLLPINRYALTVLNMMMRRRRRGVTTSTHWVSSKSK